jgi:hypothetical protein
LNSIELPPHQAEIPPGEWRRLCLAVTLGLAAAVTGFFLYVSMPIGEWLTADFRVFWLAAQLPVDIIYDPDAVTKALAQHGETGHRPYANPPSFLFAAWPFAQLPLLPGYFLWLAVSLALFIGAAGRIAGKAAWLVLVAAPAFHWAVIGGQVTLLMGGLTLGGVLLMGRRPVLAGSLFAVAALLKPQGVLLVPLALVAAGNWRALIATFAWGAGMGLLSLLVQGPELWLTWIRAIGEFDVFIRATGYIGNGITPAALAHSFGAEGAAGMLIVGAGAMLGIACCWAGFRRSDDPAIRGGAVICGSLLCTPYALPYEAVSLLPAAAALLNAPGTRRAALPAAALVVIFPFSPVAVILFALGLLWVAASARVSSHSEREQGLEVDQARDRKRGADDHVESADWPQALAAPVKDHINCRDGEDREPAKGGDGERRDEGPEGPLLEARIDRPQDQRGEAGGEPDRGGAADRPGLQHRRVIARWEYRSARS